MEFMWSRPRETCNAKLVVMRAQACTSADPSRRFLSTFDHLTQLHVQAAELHIYRPGGI